MAETTEILELDEEVVPSSYTTETESAPAGAGQSITAPGAGLGRRKEAVALFAWFPATASGPLTDALLKITSRTSCTSSS